MTTVERSTPVQPGEPAPDFTLPALHREGSVSLSAYRGQSAVVVAFFRGLWCGFCRRHIAQLATTQEKLQALGVETLAIVGTNPQRARLYLRFHPTRVPLAAEPDLVTHRLYGLPNTAMTPELDQAIRSLQVSLPGQPAPLPFEQAYAVLRQQHPYEHTETDQREFERGAGQANGQFLIDREGVVRWAYVEGTREGLADTVKFSGDEELLAAARQLPP